jgi:hypothetical protein
MRGESMKKRMKALALVLVMMFALVPTGAQAASVPCKVTKALQKAVDDNGRAIIIDQTAGKMYLYKRNCTSGKWELKKSFRCICGDRLDPKKHYLLLRNEDTDLRAYGKGSKVYEFGVYVDCYEEPPIKAIRIHSYAEIKGKVYKDSAHNTCGFAICLDNAAYVWRWYGDGTAVMGV